MALGIALQPWPAWPWLLLPAALATLNCRRAWPAVAGVCVALSLGYLAGGLRAELSARTPSLWTELSGDVWTVVARVEDGVAWPQRLLEEGSGQLGRATAGRGLLLRGAPVANGVAELRGRIEALPGRRNPGGFDASTFYARRGIGAAMVVEEADLIAPPALRLRARSALRSGVVAGLSPPAAALMEALTLGIRGDLGVLREVFSGSGLAHVLSLSGLHVGVLAAVLTAVVRGVGPLRSSLVVAVLWAYVVVVGPEAAVLRSTIMATVALLARAYGLGGAGWLNHLCLAAALSLLLQPAWLGDLGFQLSYLSVMGMGWGAGPLAEQLRKGAGWVAARRPFVRLSGALACGGSSSTRRQGWQAATLRWLVGALAVTFSAQAATLSLIASNFGGVPLISPLANLLGVPLASALVPLGFAAGLAGLISPAAAAAINQLTGAVAAALTTLATWAAATPAFPWGEVSVVGHVAYALAAVALLLGLHRAWRPFRVAVVVACAGLVTVLVPPVWAPPDLVFLDVGQGDATVLRLGRGQGVLIDGGGSPFSDFDVGARVVVPALRALGVTALPLVVATHADADHIEGLSAVLAAFPVGRLLIGHPAPAQRAFQELMAVATRRGVPVEEARRGASYLVGGARLTVLHPDHQASGVSNDDSVALSLSYRGQAWALLLGDLSAAVEAELAVPPTPLLMVPHHGSASSTSAGLLRAAGPRLAVVSVGQNRYGHPSAAVLGRLADFGVPWRTTLDEGAIRVAAP